ncbi:uncharacterized protein F4822DRAFT_444313 [Hypoxylon trugodes]|uniref:uncharacterized protein n=1 Tax=Hypoxylon trugodes TaxID=326681 RepID=UPI0021969B45|nr:uncharacterized protein F4822DRAFT_444313 [Hypoxylon trugodes]KAI1387721.1 hypothetical protein F4822DRAFT_444313 [Hypoxylon trugodes]
MDSTTTPFSRAIEAFLHQPSRKRQPRFIQSCQNDNKLDTANNINALLMNVEQDKNRRGSVKTLRLIFNAVHDYNAIVSTLVSADPMPSALIWGGLKCFNRYFTVFEMIESYLKKLAHELQFLKEYEELFQQSVPMQELLAHSYAYIIQFWAKVEDLCDSTLRLAVKSITSDPIRRLQSVIEEISDSMDRIARMVPIVQERIRRGEREDVINEQRKAEANLSQLLQLKKEEINEQRRAKIDEWLDGLTTLNESSYRHRRTRDMLRLVSGDWLIKNPVF